VARVISRGLVLLGGLLASMFLAAFIGRELQGPRWVVLFSGYLGTGLMLLSMAYSLRKRWFKLPGSLKTWLTIHEYASFFGTLLIFFHAAARFRALAPTVALLLLAVVVISGFAGREIYLDLARCRETVRRRLHSSRVMEGAGRRLRSWRTMHVKLSVGLFVFALLHLTLVGFYGGLK